LNNKQPRRTFTAPSNREEHLPHHHQARLDTTHNNNNTDIKEVAFSRIITNQRTSLPTNLPSVKSTSEPADFTPNKPTARLINRDREAFQQNKPSDISTNDPKTLPPINRPRK
jgi:hypothetical protein